MTYEFILKHRESSYSSWEVKYNCFKVPERDFERVKTKYEKFVVNSDYLLLINQCDDEGNFIQVIQ